MNMLYSNVKLFFLTLAIVLFFSSTNAHGPSRQKVSESIEINALPDEVWKVVSNFKEFEWNNTVKNVKSGGNNIGSERVIEFKSGAFIKQKLEKIDEKKMMINWRVIETDNKILPVNSYAAKIFVKSNDQKTTVLYKTGFYRGFMGNDPPPELNDENSRKLVQNFVTTNLKGLKSIIEKK